MRQPPRERPELHDADEPREVEHLTLEVLPVLDPTQVEQLGAVVDLGPETGLGEAKEGQMTT